MLEFENLIAPASPSRLQVTGKQLQAFHIWLDIFFQNLCAQHRKHKEEDSDEEQQKSIFFQLLGDEKVEYFIKKETAN